MDLALSPDIEAYWCYLILFCLALIVAVIQVRLLLKTLPNIWASAGAWLLLAAYTVVPIALFWLLDRADALHDTSVFAAILIALTYRQILSGGTQGMPVPGGFAQAWQPFVTWSNKVAAGISARIARNNSRYDGTLIEKLAANPEVYDYVRKTVLNRTSDPAKVQAALADLDKLKSTLDDAGVLEKKANYLYYALKDVPDVDSDRLLLNMGLTSKRHYYLYAREWRSKLFVISVIIAAALGIFGWISFSDFPFGAHYHLWRFQKINATSADRFRALQHLEEGLRGADPKYGELVRQQLTHQLRFEMLPLETADRILRLLLNKSLAMSDALTVELADSLRNENSDLRARTQKELVYIADARDLQIPSELRSWKPGKEDAPTCIDAVSNTWAKLAKTRKAPEPRELACLAAPAPGKAGPEKKE